MKLKLFTLSLLGFLLLSNQAESQCNLTGYRYRLPITISNINTALTDFQVKLIINTQALVSANKMLANGNDIRFTDSLCNNLPYWIESGMNTTQTNIWVKVNSLPASGNKRIFCNYGNSSASAATNGDSTFLLFDDFNGISVNGAKWISNISSGAITVASGTANINSTNMAVLVSVANLPVPYVSESKVNSASGNWPSIAQLRSTADYSGITQCMDGTSSMHLGAANAGCGGYSANFSHSGVPGNVSGIWSLSWISQNSYFSSWPSGTLSGSLNLATITPTLKTAIGPLCSGSGAMVVDWIRARKYAANTPTYAIGIEGLNIRGTNDAGISAITSPSQFFCAGSQNIVATVTNYGTNIINNVNVNWSLNGALQIPITYTQPIDTVGGSGSSTASVILGNYSFTNSNTVIKAWTSNPNSNIDTLPNNDSATVNRQPNMGGIYTIGASGNYTSFTAAINDLKLRGVCAPTIFNVQAGTYYEQVNIDAQINGASSTNTITFNGASAVTTLLTYNSASSSARHTVMFSNTSYITIQNLTIQSTGVTYGWPVHITNEATNNIRIKRCVIDVGGTIAPVSTSTDFIGIVITGSNSNWSTDVRIDNIEIDSNTINNGYIGVSYIAPYLNSAINLNIRNNFLNNQYYKGIYINSVENPQISYNDINLRQYSGSFSHGIHTYQCRPTLGTNRAVIIVGNKVRNFGNIGISIEDCVHQLGVKALVANNIVVGKGADNAYFGIYVTYSNRIMLFNNSILLNNTRTDAIYSSLYVGSTTNVSLINNILSKNNTGIGLSLYVTGSTIDSIMYNHFYKSDTSNGLAYFNNTTYQPSTIRNVSIGNLYRLPAFTNDTNLSITERCTHGLTHALITRDVDGEIRSIPPDIGADEAANLNNDVSVNNILYPTGLIQVGLNDVRVQIRNTGSNTLTSARVTYRLNNGPMRLFNWTGTLASCDTTSVIFTGLSQGNFIQGINNIVAYTELPNNNNDLNKNNDTLRAVIYTALNGQYTIGGPTPDFATFNEAVNVLRIAGVSGPVTFNVEAGTYTEQVDINFAIAGASTINTVTFDGGAGNAATRILTFNSTASNSVHTLRINGAKHTRFKNLSIQNGGANYASAILIVGTNSSSTHIKNCRVEVIGNGASLLSTNYNCILLTSSLTGTGATRIDSIEIDSNYIAGGYFGIFAVGLSGNSSQNNRFRYNNFSNISFQGIQATYQDNLKIIGNTIQMRLGVAATLGVVVTNCTPTNVAYNTEIIGNRIMGFITQGLQVTSCSNPVGRKGIIANNMIGGGQTIASAIGINLTGSTRWMLHHNTVNLDNTTSTTVSQGVVVIPSSSTQISVMNNIFSRNKPGVGQSIYINSAASIDSMNYNQFYKQDTAQGLIYIGTNYFPANFKGVGGFNTNSFYRLPVYTNDTNLRVSNECNNGLNLNIVTTDIDGKVRNNPPDVGAFEVAGASNDIGVDYVYPLAIPINTGNRNIIVRLRNYGNNIITNASLNFKLNNGSVITGTWNGTLTPCDTAVGVVQVNIPVGLSTLKVFTATPNGNTDTNASNDTATAAIATSLNGVYTIGGVTPNFANFTEAASALAVAGVSGSVTFNVRNGVYNEQINLGNVQGTSTSNRITFKAESGNRNNVTLSYAATTLANNYVIKLTGTNFVNFSSITIQATGVGSYGTAILLENSASNDSIYNCRIVGVNTTSTTSDFALLNMNNTKCDNINVSNSSFVNGSYGIIIQQTNLTNFMTGNIFANDSFTNQYYIGAHLHTQLSNRFSNNIITTNSNYPAYVCLYYTNSRSCQVNGNKMEAPFGGAGMYQTNCEGSAGFPFIISNNSIAINGANTSSYGVYSLYSNYQQFYNNSINIYGSGSFSYGMYLYYNNASYSNNEVKNNVIANSGGGYSYYVFNPAYCTSDYNNFYTSGTNLMQSNVPNSSFNNLPAWKTTTAKDYNSLSYRPGFVSTTNLAPNATDTASWSLNGRGEQLSAITSDLNNLTRSSTLAGGAPDIGAYEFTPSALPPLATANPATPVAGTTQLFLFGADTVARIVWAPASNVPANIAVRQYSGTNPPSASQGNYLSAYTDVTTPVGTFNYTINYYYKNTWRNNNPNETVLRLAKHTVATGWLTYLNANSSVDTVRNIITAAGLTSFSAFTGTNNNNPLPVTLVKFNVTPYHANPLVKWTTASEKNSSVFEIQRSTDNVTFETINKVVAKNNSNTLQQYKYIDADVVLNQNEKYEYYYRLKMVDKDGSFAHSGVVVLNNDAMVNNENSNISIYPNPYQNNFSVVVENSIAGKAKISITDVSGKLLFETNSNFTDGINTINSKEINIGVAQLNEGIYFIKIEQANGISTKKIVKQ